MGNKWRQALLHAQKQQTLHPGQYGGLPGHDCTSITFLEEIRLDYSWVTRTPFANFDNDATACYDRILTLLSSLAGRKFGIHRDVVFVHAKTLEEAQYKLKLATRMTDTAYKHCIAFPIHGTGQGSTNSPMIWTFISCTLFDCHAEKAYAMVFTDPSGDIFVRLNMIGFVDDST